MNQIQFLNSQIEKVIDTIRQNSSRPPIIILQADHGPRLLTDYASTSNTCLVEGLSTFSAYYLPGMQASDIPNDITPVNLFRIIFGKYFNTTLPLLKNAEYYPREGQSFYNFEDVTVKTAARANCSLNH